MKKLTLIFILSWGFVFSLNTFAASVHKVKGRKVLIKVENTDMSPGDKFYILSESGKKRGLVLIKKVKGSKAFGVISKKSKAAPGWSLMKKGGGSKSASRGSRSKKGSKSSSSKNMAIGFVAGINMANFTVEKIGPSEYQSDLSGMGINAKVAFDYQLFGGLWFRGLLGMESINVEDDPANAFCANGTDANNDGDLDYDFPCLTEINFIGIDLQARYVFGKGMFRPFAGGGVGLLMPMSKTSTAIREDSIKVSNVFTVLAGADIHLGESWMIPFQAEYNIFPPTDTVSANYIAIRFGVGYKF